MPFLTQLPVLAFSRCYVAGRFFEPAGVDGAYCLRVVGGLLVKLGILEPIVSLEPTTA